MAACGKDSYIDVAELIEEEFSLRVARGGPDERTRYGKRAEYFGKYQVIAANGGNRRAMIYLRNGADWSSEASEEMKQAIADFLGRQEAVTLAAYRTRTGVMVVNERGRGLVERKGAAESACLDEQRYRYRVVDGEGPLGYVENVRDRGLLDGDYHSGRSWLVVTVQSEYPDLPVQIVEMFDSRRAGDVVLFAAEGWDFSAKDLGGHGSVAAEDMLVPMVFAGPDLGEGVSIKTARIADVAPTVIDMLDRDKLTGRRFDGRSLLGQLKAKR
jgi:hypothetical protein